jgi:hypothetical protein
MLIRRAVYIAQFALTVVLPGWVLIGRGVLADGIGWEFLVYLVLCPVLFDSLAVFAALVSARKSVRVARAVSWPDAGLLLALWASLLVYGLFAFPVIAALVVVLIVALFWVALWELTDETRRRVLGFVDDLALTPEMARTRVPGDAGRIIVVPPPAIDTDDRSR